MQTHELRQVIEKADAAITRADFDALMDFYDDDATLVVRPGLTARGKGEIRKAFKAIAAYFNHELTVSQGEMVVLEGGDVALVVMETVLDAIQADGTPLHMEREATYVFRKDAAGAWRCVIDNSYGTTLLSPERFPPDDPDASA